MRGANVGFCGAPSLLRANTKPTVASSSSPPRLISSSAAGGVLLLLFRQMTPEYLDWVIKTYSIDFVVHGDDPCIGPDGKDVYGFVKVRSVQRGDYQAKPLHTAGTSDNASLRPSWGWSTAPASAPFKPAPALFAVTVKGPRHVPVDTSH